MLPVVDYARVYALKHGVAETNTLERVRQLMQIGILPAKDFNEIEQVTPDLDRANLLGTFSHLLNNGVQLFGEVMYYDSQSQLDRAPQLLAVERTD